MAADDAGWRLAITAEALSSRLHARRATMLGRFRPDAGVRNGGARMLRVQPLPRIFRRFDLAHMALLSGVAILIAHGAHSLAVQAESHAAAS